MRTLRPSVALLAAGSALLLAGCTAVPVEDDATAPPAETSGAEEPTDEASPTEDPDANGATDDCLEGTWEADTDSVRESTLAAPGIGEVDAQVEAEGTATLTFAGEELTAEYVDQVVTVTLGAEQQDVVVTVTTDGQATATYTADGTALEVSEIDVEDLTVEAAAEIDGETVAVPDLDAFSRQGLDLEGRSTYTCTDDELRITPDVEGGEQVELVLTRS